MRHEGADKCATEGANKCASKGAEGVRKQPCTRAGIEGVQPCAKAKAPMECSCAQERRRCWSAALRQ